MLRAVLFGFNGVLVDDEPIHLELFASVLEEEGVPFSRDAYLRRYLSLDDRSRFAAALADAGRSAETPQLMRLLARKASYYRERIRRNGYPFFAGAVELIQELSSARLMLGVVSGALREEVVGGLEQAGVSSCFKVLVTAEEVEAAKPDPQGYRKALETLNSRPPLPERLLHPHEVLAVEDSPGGIDAAAAVGLSTLGVAHTFPAADLAAADVVVESLAEVTLPGIEHRFAEASRA